MALYIIGDLHLALDSDKPMDVFEGWENYQQRIKANWLATVSTEDTVILAGDTSWAMRLEDCYKDFSFINALPGQKILIKGNHDYWWSTLTKMNEYVAENGFETLSFLHNNSYFTNGVAVCGTRGWTLDDTDPQDEKIINREVNRLALSLQEAQRQNPDAEKIAIIHYPPVYQDFRPSPFVDALKEYGVKQCYYGHLHGDAIQWGAAGKHGNIRYHLISADAIDFIPYHIC